MVVLIHHYFLVSSQLSAAVDNNGTGSFDSWSGGLPSHLCISCGQARIEIYAFFILSGFVLTLPFGRGSRPSWAAYYPKCIVRIYLPVGASLLFALLLAWTIPRVAGPEFSSWVNLHEETHNVLAEAFLLPEQALSVHRSGHSNGRYSSLFSCRST